MALGLKSKANTANQFCVPCCSVNINRCCTPEMIANGTESIFVHFHNFEQLSGSEYAEIFIEDFSAELKRIDIVGDYWQGLGDNYRFSRYSTGAIYLTNLGYPENTVDPYPFTTLYYIQSRIVPINLSIKRNVFNDVNNFVVPYRLRPLENYDKNGQYYADIFYDCGVDGQLSRVGVNILREILANDANPQKPEIEGLINLQSTFGASLGNITSSTNNCNPLIAFGKSANSNAGFYGPQNLIATPALVYFVEEFFVNGQWVLQTNASFVPPFTMDWYVTE